MPDAFELVTSSGCISLRTTKTQTDPRRLNSDTQAWALVPSIPFFRHRDCLYRYCDERANTGVQESSGRRIWRSARSAAVTKAPGLPHASRFCWRRVGQHPQALFRRHETKTPHKHVAGDVGGREATPARTVRPPMVDHGVRRGLRNYAGVRGHQHAVNVELD
jgi:hypothetical protein